MLEETGRCWVSENSSGCFRRGKDGSSRKDGSARNYVREEGAEAPPREEEEKGEKRLTGVGIRGSLIGWLGFAVIPENVWI